MRSLGEPAVADLLPVALVVLGLALAVWVGAAAFAGQVRRSAGLRRRSIGLGALAVVTLGAFALPALAHHTDQVDPHDTGGKLDLAEVGFDHEGAPTWRMSTFPTWTVRSIWDLGNFIVQLDTRGDAAADYVAVVRSDGRRLVAALFRLRRDGREFEVTALRTAKAGSRAATVTVPLREVSIGPNRTSYFWSVLSSFTGGLCTRTCLDAVPDAGMIEQPLPGVTPSPTPSRPQPRPQPRPRPRPPSPTPSVVSSG